MFVKIKEVQEIWFYYKHIQCSNGHTTVDYEGDFETFEEAWKAREEWCNGGAYYASPVMKGYIAVN